MADRPLVTVVRHLRTLLVGAPALAEPTDRDLLQEFVRYRAEACFETLVRRHGAMVQRLARQLASDSHDADDTFQATFLLLARKAASLSWRESVAGWLFEVAYRTAMNARANAARRRRHERQAAAMQRAEPISEADRHELRSVLDAELLRLPEKYRTPIVLCYLEGKTNEEAARLLRWPAGTVKGRLARGRDILRNRLARRGLAPATTVLAGLMAESTVSAALPAPLVLATVQAAVTFTAGQGAAAGVESLVRGALYAMHMARLKAAALVMLLTAVLAAVGGWVAQQVSAVPQQNAAQAKQPTEAGEGEKALAKKLPLLLDRHGDPLPPHALARLGTTRLRHGGIVHAVAFSLDDKVIASGSDDGTVRLWEPGTGRELRRFDMKGNAIHSIAFSPDGKRLACGSGAIWLFDLATGRLLAQSEYTHWKNSLCFSPDGGTLASASDDKMVRLWDARTLRALPTLPGHQERVMSVAFSPDGRSLASASHDNTVRLWKVRTGKEIRQFRLEAAQSVTFSSDGKVLAAGGSMRVSLWNLSTGKRLPALAGHINGATGLSFSRDGKFLAASGAGATVRRWEIGTGKELRKLHGHQGWANSVAFSRDGKTLVTGGGDHTVRLWNAASGKEVHHFSDLGEVRSIAFSPDGKTIATGDGDDAVRLWDTATNTEARKLTESAKVVEATGKAPLTIRGQHHVKTLAFSSDGKSLASAGGDGTIRLWDPATGTVRRRLIAHQGLVNCLAFSPDGKILASADDYGPAAVHLWATATGKLLHKLKGHNDRIYGVAFSPDGKTLASGGGGDYDIRLWEAATGKEVRRFTGHDYYVRSLAFSADGQHLASVTQDGSVFLWQAATGRLLARLRERGERAYSIAFSPDGKTVAAADDGGTIDLWETAARKLRLQLASPQKGISSIAFSPDNRTLATASPDTTVLFWDLTGRRQDGKWAPASLAEKEIKALWSDLAGQDAARAYRSCWRLAAAPKETVLFVEAQMSLLPVRPSAEQLAKLLADLDSAQFRVRDQAFRALQKLGDSAEPALRRDLNGKVSLERRQRLEKLLQNLASSPERLRILRTLEVLEQINTPEALQVIRRMGQGAPEAFRTKQARSVLARRSRAESR